MAAIKPVKVKETLENSKMDAAVNGQTIKST